MRSLRLTFAGLALAVAVTIVACQDTPTEPQTATLQADLGNGYPVPSFDYKLNIIGVPHDKTADMDNNNGRRIFVQLYSDNEVTNPGGKNNQLKGNDQNKIYLCNSTDGLNDYNKMNDDRCEEWRGANPGEFGVIDANATDDNGALFGIPDPCEGVDSTDGCTPYYYIWARAKTPGGSATMTTCAEEEYTGDDNDIWCGANGIELSKQTAFKAIPVTNSLLYMALTISGDEDALQNCIEGTTGVDYGTNDYNIYLFDRCFENYFWNYDNNGLKNLELRFYWADSLN